MSISNMTLEQLQQFIDDRIQSRLQELLTSIETPSDRRPWSEVQQDIERHRWTPPPGTPSVVTLLREDRDR